MLLNCVLKKCIESPLVSKEIKPVNPKGNQPWIFIGKTDAEAPILWPPDAKSQFIGKDPDAGKDWGQEEKGMTDGEMVGWHHWLSGHEFEQTLGDSEGQESLTCRSQGVTKSQTQLSDWTTTFTEYPRFFVYLFIWLCWVLLSCSMWDLVPWPGIKPGPPALRKSPDVYM